MLLSERVSSIHPERCLAALPDIAPDLAYISFLDSARRCERLGRYSFLAADPFALFRVQNGKAFWNDEPLTGSPLAALQKKLDLFHFDKIGHFDEAGENDPSLPPFRGGALGYFSYEAGHLIETLPETDEDQERIADIILPFYDLVLVVDHFGGKNDQDRTGQGEPHAQIFSSGFPARGEERRRRAQERLDWFKALLLQAQNHASSRKRTVSLSGWKSNFSRKAFESAIRKTRNYILAGDIFQANITQRFSTPLPEDRKITPLDCYLALREGNKAPFAAFLDYGDHVIASSSPERFITLDKTGAIETRPIKGTAPRDLKDARKDRQLADALETSQKDRAENVMITDLMRNDLSRVCKAGSIKVPSLCGLESYARVHHLVSTITGQLKPDMGAVDLIGASFPGGSITGAPKIRAMEIISELEGIPRNVYCGSIGYIGFDGAMDTSIAIRTLLIRNDRLHLSVGGGITALSDPATEYEECLHKASAIFRALGTTIEAERDNLAAGPDAGDRPQ